MPDEFSPSTIARLSCLLDENQLLNLIQVCETTRDTGNGYGTVEVFFSRYSAVEFRGHFAVKSPDAAHRKPEF
jgi:hypothetical protein